MELEGDSDSKDDLGDSFQSLLTEPAPEKPEDQFDNPTSQFLTEILAN